MLQREIGNAKTTAPGALPKRGDRIREFSLPTADGSLLSLSYYRGRCNLVLLFVGDGETTAHLVRAIARSLTDLEQRSTCVLAVFTKPQNQPKLGSNQKEACRILLDADSSLHRAVGAESDGQSSPAIYITDRFGEVVMLWRVSEGHQLPNISEIVSWLDYIENVCPECEPPEWPLD